MAPSFTNYCKNFNNSTYKSKNNYLFQTHHRHLDKLDKHDCAIASNLDQICFDLDNLLSKDQGKLLKSLSSNSASISDGKGIQRVLSQMENQ